MRNEELMAKIKVECIRKNNGWVQEFDIKVSPIGLL